MSYRVELAPSATRDLNRLPSAIRTRLDATIDGLTEDPRPPGAKKLAGVDDCYRVRQDDYRIVYIIRENVLVILVVAIGHRKDVYRNLQPLLKQARRNSKRPQA